MFFDFVFMHSLLCRMCVDLTPSSNCNGAPSIAPPPPGPHPLGDLFVVMLMLVEQGSAPKDCPKVCITCAFVL